MTAPPPSRRPKRRDATWKLVVAFVTPLVFAVGVVVVISRSDSGSESSTLTGGKQPNLLVVTTDDQTLESMRIMTNTNTLLAAQGTSFANYFVSFPNCCPSRASFLTGQYAHNNGVTDNVAPEGGFRKLRGEETLPVWLQRSGYYTASIGKYLNTWGQDGDISAPPGWTHWFGLIDPTTYHYFNYSVSNDGTRQDYGSEEKDYQTDVLGGEVQRTITEAGKSGKPWFVWWTPLAPHAQYSEKSPSTDSNEVDETTLPTPAPRHKGRFATEPLPRPASYDQEDVSDLPQLLQLFPRLTPSTEATLERIYRAELEALLAVDEWVGTLVKTLEDTGQIGNTIVMFTSDNGNYHGEHRLPFGKTFLYDPATHLPLIIRGPGFAAGATNRAMAVNVDLAPTILGLTGAKAGLTVDGRDLTPVARDPSLASGRAVLLESWLNRGKSDRVPMSAIHDERYLFMRTGAGYTALYDLSDDPDEVKNRTQDPALAAVKAQLADRLDKLKSCAGASCEQGAKPGG